MQFSSLYTTTTTKAQPWKVPNFLCRNKREKQKRVKKGGAQLALCVMNVSPIYPIFLKAADAFNFHGTYIVLYSLKKCCCLSFTTQVDKMQNIIYVVCKFYRYFYQLHYYLHFPQRNISESSQQHSGGLYKLFAPSNSPL